MQAQPTKSATAMRLPAGLLKHNMLKTIELHDIAAFKAMHIANK